MRLTPDKRRVLGLSLTTGLGILLNLLATLVLTRIYSPSEVGSFAAILAIASFMSVLATLRLEYAFALADRREDVRHLVATSFIIGLAISLLTSVAVYLSVRLNIIPVTSHVLLTSALSGLLVLVLSAYSILTQFNLYERSYRPIARRNWLQALTVGLLQVVFGLRVPQAPSLLLGELLGRMLALFLSNFRLLLTTSVRRPKFSVAVGRVVLMKYSNFPLQLLPAALIEAALLSIPVVLGSAVFGSSDVGALSLAIRVTAVPGTVIGVAIGQLLIGDRRIGLINLRQRVIRWIVPVTLAGLLLAGLLYAFGPSLIENAFPEQWAKIGALIQGMALFSGVSVAWLAFQQVFRLTGKLTPLLFLNLTKAGIFLLVMSIAPLINMSFESAITLSFSMAAVIDLLGIALAYRAVRT